jgi:glycosyltransferase involved in cell wall biosynthesis
MISVVICTHNPRSDYLQRVLSALKEQTFPKKEWELVLVDNASTLPLAGQWDLSWHPQSRIVLENTTGLTHARLCGIQNTSGELIVFVDDDNLLAPDYLENALDITKRLPCLGVFNGSIVGEFETPPPESVKFLLPQMAVREIHRDGGASRDRLGILQQCRKQPASKVLGAERFSACRC